MNASSVGIDERIVGNGCLIKLVDLGATKVRNMDSSCNREDAISKDEIHSYARVLQVPAHNNYYEAITKTSSDCIKFVINNAGLLREYANATTNVILVDFDWDATYC